MGALHLVNAAPPRSDALEACLRSASAGDAVLLIEDGTYAAVAAGAAPAVSAPAGVQLHVLEPDARARGLSARLQDHFTLVDHDGFVRLAVESERVVSWL